MANAKIFIAVLISLFLSMTLEAQLPYPFFDDSPLIKLIQQNFLKLTAT
jgi:hypothetical protein